MKVTRRLMAARNGVKKLEASLPEDMSEGEAKAIAQLLRSIMVQVLSQVEQRTSPTLVNMTDDLQEEAHHRRMGLLNV